jgi:hypothetical protein
MFGEINAIRALATKYSKPQLANLVQTGQLEPQKAVMAGMMIDRIAKSAMEAPQTTVAQDVLGTAPTAGQMPTAQMPPPQMAQGQMPPQMAADGGLMGMMPHSNGMAALHSGLNDMAGGGIVAFADGGDIPSFAGDRGSFIDPEFRNKDPKKIKEAQFNILAQELRDQQKAAETSEGEDKLRALNNIQMIQREMRTIKPAADLTAGINALMPSAQAAEQQRIPAGPASLKAQVAKTAPTQEESDRADFQSGLGKLGAAAKDILTLPGRGVAGAAESVITRPLRAMGVPVPYLPDEFYGGNRESMTPYYDKLRDKEPSQAKPEIKVEELPPISAPVKEEPMRIESTGGGKSTLGIVNPEQLTQKSDLNFAQAYKEQKDAYRDAGVDTDIYNKMVTEVSKKKEGMADRKERALGAALMSFGFEFASARKGQVFDKLNSAAQRSLGQYMNSMDKIADNEDKLDALNREIRMAENNFKRTGADSALTQVREREARRDAIAAKNAELRQDAAKQTEVLKVNIFGEELRANTQLTIAQGNTNARLAAAMLAQQNKGKLTSKQLFDIKQQLIPQLEPKLREQFKDFGSKEQIEKKVQEELEKAINAEINKLASNPNVGNPEPDKYSQFTLEGA